MQKEAMKVIAKIKLEQIEEVEKVIEAVENASRGMKNPGKFIVATLQLNMIWLKTRLELCTKDE